ncbi:hypothetical protein HNO92_003674 [Chromobacterium alkanivorans]|uniref:hypothetical protein n=1 Tax=Chromobacterium alkanivorans TaxID=1071719 RepID=UPI002168D1C5|nr:hypothetical protein [Chromobacterium alkanivorans]MCS3806415.1 hypothetical protein [Chromobacterium alkanivorans]MCS3820573.1 hypothetical protein [Chromobacterium alkanivorans]MCS3875331.1 hypothetical protein [Chromobacterium alkanivorans]
MMREFFSEAGLTRVWINTLPVPKFEFDTESAISFRVPVDACCMLGEIFVAVERFYSTGPKLVYGFLGCTYELISQAGLGVVVGFNDLDVPCLNHDLANSAGVSILGLDERSAQAVGSAIKIKVKDLMHDLPSGNLVINYAISSEIGSSPNLFRDLAEYLVDQVVLEVKRLQLLGLSK